MRSPPELPLTAERDNDVTLSEQVATQIRDAMTDGRLAAGEQREWQRFGERMT